MHDDDAELVDGLEEPGGLQAVRTPPDLWTELLMHGAGRGTSLRIADSVFRRLHGDGQDGALTSALLLLTDWRWRRWTGDLLTRIIASGILSDDDLDELADTLLGSDTVQFCMPASWFDGPVVTIAVDDPVEADAAPVDDADGADDDEEIGVQVGIPRDVQPPLRRWGAARLVRRQPDLLGVVRDRVRVLERRDAAAAMTGILDALDVLPADDGDAMVREGLRWSDKNVRRLALRLLAEHGDRDDAVRRAQRDPDASIRAFAPALAGTAAAPALF